MIIESSSFEERDLRGTDQLVQDEETGSAFGRDWAVVHGRLL